MKDKKDILSYIKGYEFKKEYNEERLHTGSLYDGIYAVGNYSAMRLIQDSIHVHIGVAEEDISTTYALFKQVCELQDFLEDNKDKLERLSKESLIAEFTLEDPEQDGTISFMPDLDSSILYNGKGYDSLEWLKNRCGSRISYVLKLRAELLVIEDKLSTSFKDDAYLYEDSEIKEDFMNSYSKLNLTRLNEYFDADGTITDKQRIFEEIIISKRSDSSWRYRGNYSSYIVRTFDMDLYINYCYILDVYKQMSEYKLEDEEQ